MFMLGMGLSLVSNTNAYLLCYSFCERIDILSWHSIHCFGHVLIILFAIILFPYLM